MTKQYVLPQTVISLEDDGVHSVVCVILWIDFFVFSSKNTFSKWYAVSPMRIREVVWTTRARCKVALPMSR